VLEGERFLLQRTQAKHPEFPDALSVLGETDEGLVSHYFDSRGAHRIYRLGFDDGVWQLWRDEPGFSQRFTGTRSSTRKSPQRGWRVSEARADGLRIPWYHGMVILIHRTGVRQ
jgi:hypothetical protein